MLRLTNVVVLIVLASPSLRTQAPAGGTISGVARDEHGAVVAGVAVTATSAAVAGEFTATTDRTGYYRFPDLPPGEYIVTGTFSGFATFVRPAVIVRAGLNVTIDLAMAVGGIDETVEVRVESPLLETRAGAQAVIMHRGDVAELVDEDEDDDPAGHQQRRHHRHPTYDQQTGVDDDAHQH